jgi:hypothetical protein
MREGYEALGGACSPGEEWQCENVETAELAGELSHSGNAKTGIGHFAPLISDGYRAFGQDW